MSDSSKKSTSVAAFLFMPQLGLCFQHSSLIVPIFIRTIAMMFVQAGLLPPNHPAARYGTEGIRKYKFSELIGEAWYNLRSIHATPYQWSLFAGVMLMIAMIILSGIMALLNISGMLVSSASAQIFDGLFGPNTTNSATVPAAANPLDVFDRSVDPATGMLTGGYALGQPHGDWGIMILDKMLRQGAEMKGGLMQNAFGSLMQIYNTGILVIAGIMIFWLILFVVTDTAKTGMIGGQRHNMVWAPIRIVFALGLMIPLGASGFSSGQYMVMKLAEWGSNFGSRGWYTYVQTIVNNQSVLAKYGDPTPSNLMSQYLQMYICRVAYNGYINQTGALTGPQTVITHRRINNSLTPGRSQFFFTNETYKNLCGSADWPSYNSEAIVRLLTSPLAMDQAVGQYQNLLAQAYYTLFFGGNASDAIVLVQNDDGVLAPTARKLACAFVAQSIYKSVGDPTEPLDAGNLPGLIFGLGGNTPAACNPGDIAAGSCGAGAPGSGQYPDMSCMEGGGMIGIYNSTMAAAHAAGDALLTAALGAGGAMLTDVKNQGWPGMGIWYHQIERLNDSVGLLKKPGLSFTKGDRSPIAGTPVGAKVDEILNKFQPWWSDYSATTDGSNVSEIMTSTTAAQIGNNIVVNTSQVDLKNKIDGAQDSTPEGFAGEVLEMAGGDQVARFFLDMSDPADINTYPLAKLAKLGNSLQQIALMIYGGVALLEIIGAGLAGGAQGLAMAAGQSLLGAVGGGVGQGVTMGILEGVKAFIAGPVTAVVTTFAGILFAASLVLMYYVPMIPFVRVAYSVLTWMMTVFEAVVMVPIAALAHLNTEGEGLGGGARAAWIMWLHILLRPILTVIGFVGALLVFNTFVVWIHDAFAFFMMKSFPRGAGTGLFQPLAFCVIYVFIIYTVANSCFKLLDIIPAAMFKWMPGGGGFDSFNEDNRGMFQPAGQLGQAMGTKMRVGRPSGGGGKPPPSSGGGPKVTGTA